MKELGNCLCGLPAVATVPVLAEGFSLPVCERHAADRDTSPPRWMVVAKRETEPITATVFDRYDEASMYWDRVQVQWSDVYFCRIAYGPHGNGMAGERPYVGAPPHADAPPTPALTRYHVGFDVDMMLTYLQPVEGGSRKANFDDVVLYSEVAPLLTALAEKDAYVAQLEGSLQWQASITKALLPYQDRAVKAEADCKEFIASLNLSEKHRAEDASTVAELRAEVARLSSERSAADAPRSTPAPPEPFVDWFSAKKALTAGVNACFEEGVRCDTAAHRASDESMRKSAENWRVHGAVIDAYIRQVDRLAGSEGDVPAPLPARKAGNECDYIHRTCVEAWPQDPASWCDGCRAEHWHDPVAAVPPGAADAREPLVTGEQMNTHGIERTSPKGGPFFGTCRYCGKEDLPMEAALAPCEKAPSRDQQILDAVAPAAPRETTPPSDELLALAAELRAEAKTWKSSTPSLEWIMKVQRNNVCRIADRLALLAGKEPE